MYYIRFLCNTFYIKYVLHRILCNTNHEKYVLQMYYISFFCNTVFRDTNPNVIHEFQLIHTKKSSIARLFSRVCVLQTP